MEKFILIPEWTTGSIILYGCLALLAFGVAPLEYYGQSMMAYSKFRPAHGGLSPRVGMFTIYFLPLLALIVSGLPYLAKPSLIQIIVFATVAIHFSKRVLESLFLHKYSGPIGILTTFMIAGFYSFIAYLIGSLNRQPLQSMDIWFYIGVRLFIVGIFGNFIHHKILTDLRKDTLDYIIPTGGFFDLIVCPHYLFEIVTWVGVFLVSRHLASLLALIFIIGYLSARSIRTLKWYKKRFSEFPAARKAIIPFIL